MMVLKKPSRFKKEKCKEIPSLLFLICSLLCHYFFRESTRISAVFEQQISYGSLQIKMKAYKIKLNRSYWLGTSSLTLCAGPESKS